MFALAAKSEASNALRCRTGVTVAALHAYPEMKTNS
jgi:hypothetical protein